MFDFNNKEKKWNIIFMAFCVILVVLLAGMLIWSKKTEAAESKRLQAIAAGKKEDTKTKQRTDRRRQKVQKRKIRRQKRRPKRTRKALYAGGMI